SPVGGVGNVNLIRHWVHANTCRLVADSDGGTAICRAINHGHVVAGSVGDIDSVRNRVHSYSHRPRAHDKSYAGNVVCSIDWRKPAHRAAAVGYITRVRNWIHRESRGMGN